MQTTEEHIVNKVQLWDTIRPISQRIYILSLKEGMLRQTNISVALLYFGMPNSFRKLLLCAILKFFNVVF